MSYKTYLQSEFSKPPTVGGSHGSSHHVYWVSIEFFNKLNNSDISSWKYNRPPDEDRIQEIHNYMKESKRMDGIIYLAFIDNKLVCYESNHRREALKGITELAFILVDIIWDATDDIIKQEFMRLNKSVSVPELYIAPDPDIVLREQIDEFVNRFNVKYKAYKSTSRTSCQRPNYISDNFKDQIYNIIKKYDITVKQFEDRLNEINEIIPQQLSNFKKLSDNITKKCISGGLWVFAWDNRLHIPDFDI